MADTHPLPWQIETLRLSAFFSSPIDPESANFWTSIIDHPPAERRMQPQQQLAVEHGPCLTGQLSVQTRPNRCDWRLTPSPPNQPRDLITLGSFPSTLPDFQALSNNWLTQCPPINRIAFGTVLLSPCDNLSEAYARLSCLLPNITIDPNNTHDLLYRINRRRFSTAGIPDLLINRISTWTVTQIIDTLVELSPVSPNTASVHATTTHTVCRLELDINTIAEQTTPLAPSLLTNTFDELVNLANEIVKAGDIP